MNEPSFGYFGSYIPGIPIPTPFCIALLCFLVTFLILKFTTLGLYVQSVGINEKTSRLNGLNPEMIKLMTYVFLGICVAVTGFIKVSRLSTINYSVVAKDIEMDAILAVALGGNALSGGKFSIPAYKAVVVIILVIMSAPAVREKLSQLGKKLRAEKHTAESA